MAAGNQSLQNHCPVWVILDTTNIGLCNEGDITVEFNESWVPQLSHQTGVTPIDAFYKGSAPVVTISAIEILNWDMWLRAFPNGQKQRDTATPPHNRFTSKTIANHTSSNLIGQKASAVFKELTLRPEATYVAAATEDEFDMKFPRVICTSVGTMAFSVDNPQALNMVFTAFEDISNVGGQTPWYRGYKTATGSWLAT